MVSHLQIVFLILFTNQVISATNVTQTDLQFGFTGNISTSSAHNHNKTVVCVLDSWSHWRKEKFLITNIDTTLCTQLVYRTAHIDNNTFQITFKDQYLDDVIGWYRSVVGLSHADHKLKVLLSIGGWTEGSWRFSKIAADFEKRSAFVQSVFQILQRYEFHGVDFAWEYPSLKSSGGTSDDKENLPLLLRDLRSALMDKYMLTITVPGDIQSASDGYDVKVISKFVDQFNIRTFDYSGGWDSVAYHQSALVDEEGKNSVEKAVKWYLNNGAPADKLVVGIPTYGRTFLLTNDNNDTGLGQSSAGGFAGNWLSDPGLMSYREMCHNISTDRNKWKTYSDSVHEVPFAKNGRRWISFDNPTSIEAKAAFIVNTNLKGAFLWTIDTDDYRGDSCSFQSSAQQVNYPLLRTVNYVFANGQPKKHLKTPKSEENSNAIIIDATSNSDKYKYDKFCLGLFVVVIMARPELL